jgi:hypothetical protein
MSGFGTAVSYALSLESKQFLDGLRSARAEARKAAKEIESSGQQGAKGLAGLGQAGKAAGDALKVFSAAGNAFAQALSGNLTGAAMNAATAIKGLTAAMQANPVMLLVSALAALGQVLGEVASKWSKYRERVADAAEEHERFVRHLHDMQFGNPSEQYVDSHVEGFKTVVGEGNVNLSQEILESQRREVEERRRDAEKASEKAKHWASLNPKGQFTYDDPTAPFGYVHVTGAEGAARAKTERDAAEEAYRRQLEILRGYEAVLAKHDGQQAEADARAKRIAAEAAEASAAEMERRAAALAEGDEEAMRQHLKRMKSAVDEKFGPEADYEGRLKAGTASREEVTARRSVEDYAGRIAEVVAREAAKAADEAERERQRAAAAWTESRQADERLDRSRESALVSGGDANALRAWAARLGREADVRFGEWTPSKAMSATQDELDARATVARMQNEARQIEDARRREQEQRQRAADAERRERHQERRSAVENRVANVRLSEDPALMEKAARAMFADANKRYGRLTSARFVNMSAEEREQRTTAKDLMDQARKIREEQRGGVGVLAVRGMTVGDVFNEMRGMGGAKMAEDKGEDEERRHRKKVDSIEGHVKRIAEALTGESGVA